MNIEARLASLEKSNRRLRAGLVLLTLVSVAAFHFGAAAGVPDKLQAKSLEIVGDNGKPLLSVEPDHFGAKLRMVNTVGKECIVLAPDQLGGSITVGGDDFDRSEVMLSADRVMGGFVHVTRADNNLIDLATDKDYDPRIIVQRSGKPVWCSLPTFKAPQP